MNGKERFWFQVVLIVFILATMDCIIRGPMNNVAKQIEIQNDLISRTSNDHLTELTKRVAILSEILEQQAK